MVGGELVVAVGHQGALGGANLPDQFHEARVVADAGAVAAPGTRHGIALDVEFHRQHRGQLEAVLRTNMALVRARMHGNAVGARRDAHAGVFGDAGVGGVARVADQGNFVEIDAERDHRALVRTISLITMGCSGTSVNPDTLPVGAVAMKSTMSIPRITSPNTV